MSEAAPENISDTDNEERLRRWRLMLGREADGTGYALAAGQDLGMDRTLEALYQSPGAKGRGGLGGSNPNVARWLGDIRTYFPTPVVQVMQKDALDRLDLKQLLLEPELLSVVEPDIHLVSTLIALNRVIPEKTRETARQVVRKVVQELEDRLQGALQQAVLGSLNRAVHTRRPRHQEINWHRTILANLKHYQPDYHTIIPETRIGYGRKRGGSLLDVILCVDQSGSMASSVVYASVFAAALASLRAVRTSLVVFDTAVVDLTDELHDPVDVLFGTQLGGGTDIGRALGYCQDLVRTPRETILVLISDLYDGGSTAEQHARIKQLVHDGVQVITLLALSDKGAPAYSRDTAAFFASLGIPCFACTPEHFPALMAAAIKREDVALWAAREGIVTAQSSGGD